MGAGGACCRARVTELCSALKEGVKHFREQKGSIKAGKMKFTCAGGRPGLMLTALWENSQGFFLFCFPCPGLVFHTPEVVCVRYQKMLLSDTWLRCWCGNAMGNRAACVLRNDMASCSTFGNIAKAAPRSNVVLGELVLFS